VPIVRPATPAVTAGWSGFALGRHYAAGVTELFHVTDRVTWLEAAGMGEYRMSTRGITLADQGFIHCALRHQLPAIVELVYGDVADDQLVVLIIDSNDVPAPVRFEAAEPGGEEYPHIYGALPVSAVLDTIAVVRDATGNIVLPS